MRTEDEEIARRACEQLSSIASVELGPIGPAQLVAITGLVLLGMDHPEAGPAFRQIGSAFVGDVRASFSGYPAVQAAIRKDETATLAIAADAPSTDMLRIALVVDPNAPLYRRAAYRCLSSHDPSAEGEDGTPCGALVCHFRLDQAELAAYQHALDRHDDPSPFVFIEGQP